MRRLLTTSFLVMTLNSSALAFGEYFPIAQVNSGDGRMIEVQTRPSGPSGPSRPARTSRPSTPRAPSFSAPSVAEPVIPATPVPSAPAISGLSAGAQELDWFWEVVPTQLSKAGPENLLIAEAVLFTPPEGEKMPAPTLEGMTQLAERYGVEILIATLGRDISPALILAVVAVESGGKPDARSTAGALGLMQLMPATASRFQVDNVFDVQENLTAGTEYLDWLLDEFDQDIIMALAGYNAGENAVDRFGGVPPYVETRNYIPKVIAAWQVARTLCITPPDGVRDGCVFNVNWD